MDSQTWDTRRLSFGPAADLYDRVRPRYPVEALHWMLSMVGDRPVRVVDLGAGTGILSRQLAELGHQVIAVEPDAGMRARHGSAVEGSAEHIPLPDGAVDAVVAGQAYHWFDPDRTHLEVARVLHPGGVFAALWNDADARTQWTVTFTEIIDGPREPMPLSDFGPRFGAVGQAEFPHDVWTTADDLVALASTRSPYLVGSPTEREQIVVAVRRLITEAGLTGRFAMPHVTRVHRAVRR